jgi:hypothetical protein
MWGLLLLFYAVAYFAAVGLLLYKVKPYWGKALVLVAAVLIPNADDWYYRHQLADYCKNEAGFKVYQQVSRKEGLIFPSGLYMDDPLKYVPVSFVEWKDIYAITTPRYLRSDRLADGGISKPYEISQSNARYETRRLEQKNGTFTEVKLQIVRRDQGAVVGEFQTKFYYGGWFPGALISGQGGLVAGCGKGGQVLSHKQWIQDKTDKTTFEPDQRYEADGHSFHQIIRRVFSKD